MTQEQIINRVNISRALSEYHARTGVRMTQHELGERIFGLKNGGEWYVNRWNTGKDPARFEPRHVRAICEILGCDANTLFT